MKVPVALALLLAACSPEPGAWPKPIQPRDITVHMMTPEELRELRRTGIEATATSIGNLCLIRERPPAGYDDTSTWRIWFHELRHCNGERHDKAGVWLP